METWHIAVTLSDFILILIFTVPTFSILKKFWLEDKEEEEGLASVFHKVNVDCLSFNFNGEIIFYCWYNSGDKFEE